MNIIDLSVRRPIFMSCILVALMFVGVKSFKSLPVDLFPDVSFPIVTVSVPYPGAGPQEVETLVARPLEEELSGISGMKNLRSVNSEGNSFVVAEFTLDTDVKYAEQQMRDRVSSVRRKLPRDILEPVIRKIDAADQAMMVLALKAPLNAAEIYNLANETIKPQLEQVPNVGRVEIVGGRKREIQILLDRNRLSERQVSVTQVAMALQNSGVNLPSGKIDRNKSEVVFRTLGEFNDLASLNDFTLSLYGNDVATRVKDLGSVEDTLEDESNRAYLNGEPSLFLKVYKQSKANTVEVSRNVQLRLEKINAEILKPKGKDFQISILQDMARMVKANVDDVYESIGIGVLLTVLVVFLFLGSFRSTFITGLAIPVSLVGGMALFSVFGLTINVMSLLALSLAVGLLIDDAIVVRENIFRHLEMGKSAKQAALEGTKEVAMAVIAVTFCILAVFGPIAFLSGVVGQFFKSFGLGVCFVMAISLFDALTNAPMMSAYFGGTHGERKQGFVAKLLASFDRFQTGLENVYGKILAYILAHPVLTSLGTLIVVIALGSTVIFIPKTFLPAQENGEFVVTLEMPRGTTLDQMTEESKKVDEILKKNSNVKDRFMTVGDDKGQSNVAEFYVSLVAFKDRTQSTTAVKQEMRDALKGLAYLNPVVKDFDAFGFNVRPFTINIRGHNLEELKVVAEQLFQKLKNHKAISDPEISDKPGLSEFQVSVDDKKAQSFGVTTAQVGAELRAQVEGLVPTTFREEGLEYDIRVRLKNEQRDLAQDFNQIQVPNLNRRLVSLHQFSEMKSSVGSATINRDNRVRFISVGSDIVPGGPGMGAAISDIKKWFATGEVALKDGMSYRFVGQAENFQELAESMKNAVLMAVVFIFLVLASLYESIVTPFVIMLVIPLALVGGFFGLFLFGSSLDLFSMIGCIMLMGLATKNSIILVDYIRQKEEEGLSIRDAILAAGRSRLRPILMTSFALVAGMIPVAIGLNEASSQRTSLGIAVIGGVAVSTILTLLIIPALYQGIEKARRWVIANIGNRFVNQDAK